MTIEELKACSSDDMNELFREIRLKAKLKTFPKRDEHRKKFFKRLNESSSFENLKEDIKRIYNDME